MTFEKRMKQRIQQIDQNLDSMVKNPYQKKSHFPLWAKISIPVCSVALSVAIALAVAIPFMQSNRFSQLNQLTKPKLNKIVEASTTSVSSLTYNSYNSFAKKYVSLIMNETNKDTEKSLGVSIPDAYVGLAIVGLISSEECLEDVLTYLELGSADELKVATHEVLEVLGTLSKDKAGRLSGGCNLNSIWLNPNVVELLDKKDEDLYGDLEEIFDTSVFLEQFSLNKANTYLKRNTLKGMPIPEIKTDDMHQSAIDVVSTYTCLDYFTEDASKTYKEEYQSKNHKMDYTFNGVSTRVDYIDRKEENGYVYEGDSFYGAAINMKYLSINFFLPNNFDDYPSSIAGDVLNHNYGYKKTTYIDSSTGEECQTTRHDIYIKAPYFTLNNSVSVKKESLVNLFPNLTTNGFGARMVRNKSGSSVFLDCLKQFSVMSFNYNGFYSSSLTVASGSKGAHRDLPGQFELLLDHPFAFEVDKTIRVNEDNEYHKIPMIFGEVINPNYTE